ncbi:MAG: glycosyltransferase [Anaerolineaceae bacterium]|nr:glycosyltransferase [Anaerolineaceae bacterium]
MSSLIAYSIFWVVWLLVPILIDGISIVTGVIGKLLNHASTRETKALEYFPHVSVIVPVLNGEKTLEDCIRSIAAQDYPLENIEVMVIDNGSTDNTFGVFQQLSDLDLRVTWHSIVGRGKAWALNSGIYLSQARYLINIDCDLKLDPNAIRSALRYMEHHQDVGAATGYLSILPPPEEASRSRRMLANLEFIEYAAVFGVGRSYQTQLDALYTLSGAFSIFRRDVLLKTFLYNPDTVSEDTDLTFQLYARAGGQRIVSLQDAIAYLHPIESWEKLYSQRVRWQRGQLEVSALHDELVKRPWWKFRGLSPSRSLMIDHTLALPRLIWLVFLPVLADFGYSPQLIFTSYVVMYLFYLAIESIWWLAALRYALPEIRQRMIRGIKYLPLMPFYQVILFLFRVSGFIYAINEPFEWQVANPKEQLLKAVRSALDWLGMEDARRGTLHPARLLRALGRWTGLF